MHFDGLTKNNKGKIMAIELFILSRAFQYVMANTKNVIGWVEEVTNHTYCAGGRRLWCVKLSSSVTAFISVADVFMAQAFAFIWVSSRLCNYHIVVEIINSFKLESMYLRMENNIWHNSFICFFWKLFCKFFYTGILQELSK